MPLLVGGAAVTLTLKIFLWTVNMYNQEQTKQLKNHFIKENSGILSADNVP